MIISDVSYRHWVSNCSANPYTRSSTKQVKDTVTPHKCGDNPPEIIISSVGITTTQGGITTRPGTKIPMIS